jgi:signal peptidase I
MKLLKEAFGWVGTLVTAFAISILISTFVFQPTKVLGSSMEPTLRDQQRIYILKIPHTLNNMPEYGDVVIIDSRVNRERTLKDDLKENPFYKLVSGSENTDIWVKRVIGKPGDVLEFKDGKVFRNGQPLEEPYLKETMKYTSPKKFTVPDNHVYVMGDNRNHSSDSRMIGSVPLDHVLGVKVF